jgi:transporter family protein
MLTDNWLVWALLSAVFAALMSIFAKVGMQKIDTDYATLLRTIVVLPCLVLFVGFTGKWQNPFDLSWKALMFVALSALATGASWVCYFRALQLGEAAQVAPVDKSSLVMVVIFAAAFLGERPSWPHWVGVVILGIKW